MNDPYQNDQGHHSRDCLVVNNTIVSCRQRTGEPGAVRIGCIGDSITAVGHTSGVEYHWPNQLEGFLEDAFGNGTYAVTNLGICGSAVQSQASLPWNTTPAFTTLMDNRWDVLVVMLGTNDAAPTAQGYWPDDNHKHCDQAANVTDLAECNFASEFSALLETIRTGDIGPVSGGVPPVVHVMIPPPLMEDGAYNMNQTIINTIFPRLIPLIAEDNADLVSSVVDVYSGMGGVPSPEWEVQMPAECVLNSSWAPCKWFCDAQSCDQCHPNDVGCGHLAEVVYDDLFKPNMF